MKRFFGFSVVAISVFTIVAFFSRYDVDPHHDGIFLKPAIDMLHGQRLFTDSFSIYGPLTSVIQSIAMKLFGEQLIVLKILTAATYGLIGGTLFLISSFLMPMAYALLTIVLWISTAPYYEPEIALFIWPSVYALLSQLLSALFLYSWLHKKNVAALIVAGMCTAITFWFRQPVGVLLYVAILLFFFLHKKRLSHASTIPYHLSFIGVHLLVITVLFLYGVLNDWFFQSVIFVSWWHAAVVGARIFPILILEKLLPLSFSAFSIWVILPLGALYILWKKNSPPALTLLALISIGSWAQYYPMNDIHHIYWAATPMFPLIVGVCFWKCKKQHKRLIMMVLLCILFLPDTYNRLRMIKHKLAKNYIQIQKPFILKDMLVQKEQYDEIQRIYSQIRTYEDIHPTGRVITSGGRVLFTTFAQNKKNCHPFTSNWGWEVYNHDFNAKYQNTINACEKKGALIIK